MGGFGVQIAAARGARVIGTASESSHDYLRALGAEPTTYGDGLTERVLALAAGGSTPSPTSPADSWRPPSRCCATAVRTRLSPTRA
ncbi:hypothetical protein [Microbacterium sp.]|uniref:hypothetical protein n=1 Tax=Microbacterium sp. TaxID=51671 RepID=UPI00281128B8|nr:hypothetical protein [Microbacterium sp.]